MYAIKVYAIPENPVQAAHSWKKTGFDWVMVGPDCVPPGRTDGNVAQPGKDAFRYFIAAIKNAGLLWSAIEPVFLAMEGDADADLARTMEGAPAVDDWVRFVCPTRDGPRRRFFERLERILSWSPDGISFDFARFFGFWEMIGPECETGGGRSPRAGSLSALDRIKPTCGCPSCKADQDDFFDSFEKSGASVSRDPGLWRTEKVRSRLASAAEFARRRCPNIRIGLHTVPWTADEYGGAVASLLGQEIETLSSLVDYLTPMAYHHMTGREPDWIARVVRDQRERSGGLVPVVPCIQASPCYTERSLAADEFHASVMNALDSPSGGLAVYSHETLFRQPEKIEIVASCLAGRTGP